MRLIEMMIYIEIPVAIALAIYYKKRSKTPISILSLSLLAYGPMCFILVSLNKPFLYISYIVLRAIDDKTGYAFISVYIISAAVTALFAWVILKHTDKRVALRFYADTKAKTK